VREATGWRCEEVKIQWAAKISIGGEIVCVWILARALRARDVAFTAIHVVGKLKGKLQYPGSCLMGIS
jgi:hypothetical protein